MPDRALVKNKQWNFRSKIGLPLICAMEDRVRTSSGRWLVALIVAIAVVIVNLVKWNLFSRSHTCEFRVRIGSEQVRILW